ncbi:MAG: hypothetical protein K6G38_02195, partial [Gammaproteobacteria bacterium]|nr:hypothetical protein [Gammaproteobacteria bacterium]
YKDEVKDDFGLVQYKDKSLGNYKYKKNFVFKFFSFVIYYLIAKLLVALYTKIVFLQTFKNKKVLRGMKRKGAFFYFNHTSALYDATIPSMLKAFKMNYVLVQKTSVLIPFAGVLVNLLGGTPVADSIKLTKDMHKFIFDEIEKGRTITIYPEAHIWPFYTDVRDFSEKSFFYPTKCEAPVYAITNCLKKRKIGKLPRVVTYVDGPFYKKDELSSKENMKYLKEKCYNAMKKRLSENSTWDYYKYVKIDEGESRIEIVKK